MEKNEEPTLFSQENKEKQQDAADEMRMMRKKQMAIIKAQNEMLASARRQAEEKYGDDEYNLNKVTKLIDSAIQENKEMGESYLKASPDEIEASQYHEPSKYWVDKYQQRLNAKGISDEEMRKKDIATAEKKKEPKKRKPKEIVKEEPKQDAPFVTVSGKTVASDIMANSKPAEGYKPFDPKSVPDYVQYDVLPLPSKGQCYPHKKSTVPVSYITAADENLIVSPNLYRDGKITDLILKRKILDPDFDVDKMCQGDKDAIILWLRANAYGDEFPITTTNPDTGKEYSLSIKLSDFLDKFKEFNLVGDENGYFDYTTSNGTNIKWKIVSGFEMSNLRKLLSEKLEIKWKVDAYRLLRELSKTVDNIDDAEWNEVKNDIAELVEEIDALPVKTDSDKEDIYTEAITEEMILKTVSVNGNSDKDFVRKYIENMRAGEARAYRQYTNNNQPGVDMTIEVTIPESDGGGSYETFLKLDEFIFLNV